MYDFAGYKFQKMFATDNQRTLVQLSMSSDTLLTANRPDLYCFQSWITWGSRLILDTFVVKTVIIDVLTSSNLLHPDFTILRFYTLHCKSKSIMYFNGDSSSFRFNHFLLSSVHKYSFAFTRSFGLSLTEKNFSTSGTSSVGDPAIDMPSR